MASRPNKPIKESNDGKAEKNPERQGWSLLSLPSYYWAEQGAPRPGITANCSLLPRPKFRFSSVWKRSPSIWNRRTAISTFRPI